MHSRVSNSDLVAKGILALGLFALQGSVARAEQWLELFGQPTISGQVAALTEFQDKLYVSGDLYQVADQQVAGLATYDYKTRQWAPVQLDFGEGFISMAGFSSPNDDTLFLAPRCCSNTLTLLRNGTKSEVQLDGFTNELIFIEFDSGPRIVATGAFEVDQQGFSLAIWDGMRWSYEASLVISTRDPVIFQRDGKTSLVAFSRDQQTQVLVVWDGSQTSYHEIPTDRSVRGIATANGLIYACSDSELLSWDGSSWNYSWLYFGFCTGLASRPKGSGRELVIRTLSGQLLFTDGLRTAAPDATFPGTFSYRSVMISTPSKLFYIGGRFSGNQYQFTVWDGTEWTFPQADFRSSKNLATVARGEMVADRLYVFGDFLKQPDGQTFSSATWTDQGPAPLENALANTPISAVSTDLGTFYGASPEGLVVSTADSSRTIPFAEKICSMEFSDADGDQLFFLDCLGNAYLFDGDQITSAGQGSSACFRCYGRLHAIGSPSPAAAVYAVAVVGANSGKSPFFSSMRIRRWSGTDWQDITPPEFASVIFSSSESSVLSSFQYKGSEKLFAAVGSHFGFFDGVSWTLFPELEGRTLLGPIASYQDAETVCFFVAEHRQIARLCGDKWQRSAHLALHSRNFGYLPFGPGPQLVDIMHSTTYLSRPALLVAGRFDAAGSSTQGRFAVLDLDALFADGMEF